MNLNLDSKMNIRLDPRTCLLLLVTLPAFLIAGAGGTYMEVFRIIFAILPYIILFLSGYFLYAVLSFIPWIIIYLLGKVIPLDTTEGLYICYMIAYEFLVVLAPCGIMGIFVLRTVSASEIIVALEKFYIPSFLTIPLVVVFRFIPTMKEEMQHISKAMRMRNITISSVGLFNYLECKFIPLLMCVLNIGNELIVSAISRGLGSGIKRTSIHILKFRMVDYFLIMVCLMSYVVLLLKICGIRLW